MRHPFNGLLSLSDNRGRILAETATVPCRFISISGILNVAPEETFYTQTGDWFAWLCVAALAVLLAFQLLPQFDQSKAYEKPKTRELSLL